MTLLLETEDVNRKDLFLMKNNDEKTKTFEVKPRKVVEILEDKEIRSVVERGKQAHRDEAMIEVEKLKTTNIFDDHVSSGC